MPPNIMITAVALPASSAMPSVTAVTGSLRGGGADGAGDGSGRSHANGAAPSGSHAGGVTGGSAEPAAPRPSFTSDGPVPAADVATVGTPACAWATRLPRLRCSRYSNPATTSSGSSTSGPLPPNTLPIVTAAAMASPTTRKPRGRLGRGAAGSAGSSGSRIQPAT